MAITLNRWEAEIVVPTGGWDGELVETPAQGGTSGTVTITAGTYTWATFLVEIESALEATGNFSYTPSLDDGDGGTGLLTIVTAPLFEWTLAFTDTDWRDLMGFAGDLDSGSTTSFTGTKHVKGMWLPDCPHLCTYQFGDEKDVSDRSTLMSPDGTNASNLAYNRVRVLPDLRYQTVDRQRARAAGEVYTNESWATFWRDVIDGDQSYFRVGKVRIFPDADTDGTSYQYWYGDQRECAPANVREGWQKLWLISMPPLTRVET